MAMRHNLFGEPLSQALGSQMLGSPMAQAQYEAMKRDEISKYLGIAARQQQAAAKPQPPEPNKVLLLLGDDE